MKSSNETRRKSGFRRVHSIIMADEAAEAARLMNVIDALVAELDRQGLTEALVNVGFDATPLAKEAIKAADGGDVVLFPGTPRGH
jgi:hypothetical protein